jgi:hypothetical protein
MRTPFAGEVPSGLKQRSQANTSAALVSALPGARKAHVPPKSRPDYTTLIRMRLAVTEIIFRVCAVASSFGNRSIADRQDLLEDVLLREIKEAELFIFQV